ncbi:MAG: permease [Oscillospiraceae bacterium]|jgi:putative transport protein
MNSLAVWYTGLSGSTQTVVLLATVFTIVFLGYMLGRITICGLSLGTSGILIVSLFFGHYIGKLLTGISQLPVDSSVISSSTSLINNSLKIIEQLGLVCFVTSVGFIAGPVFFNNFKSNAGSYIVMGVLIILIGACACAAVIKFFGVETDIAVGLYTGALTSTPALSAAKEALGNNAATGYAIGYPFGVVGVVLFVQLMPKLLKADIDKEVAKLRVGGAKEENAKKEGSYFLFEKYGFFPFGIAVTLGLMLGSITINTTGVEFLGFGASGGTRIFSLGATGGSLIVGLVLGYLGHIGPVSLKIPKTTLNAMRELGLVFFLIGAGVSGGKDFAAKISEYGPVLFLYGAVITLVPMIVAYIVGRYILKLDMFNYLGSITGGMTSTPALGSLISVAGSDDVAASYAATYPVALLLVVLSIQFFAAVF